ncbi:membrane-bound alkaline phosphatase-like [Ostrinia furnacalis]|uniref:membrane-bound alkaline phosphatase-like n=1 Tax=Ostrinia furnacalis TaxID=93504 RepID=UPI00103AD486|nr:membrane-bound alkaline phosphatase-like [Ostrinia furnacalis]
MLRLLLVLAALTHLSFERDVYHPSLRSSASEALLSNKAEMQPSYWAEEARAGIERRLRRRGGPRGRARNVVMFLGDGMSVPTLGAARALLGQRQGLTGEEAQLSFEQFPTVGLSKTYCVDAQIADSACTATAYLCGVKTNYGTIGVTPAVARRNCSHAADPATHVRSIAAWALDAGKDAGIVTTTRVTHASPAGAYAHTAQRDWEDDAELRLECGDADPAARQRDIAHQLVHSAPGNQFKVILGGGRREFLPNTMVDEEGTPGKRADGNNLIEAWEADKRERNVSYQYVWNRKQLMQLSLSPPEYLLGLFEGNHMQYHMQADPETEPTLAELTEIAIRSLNRNENGFFLFVEGGRIDHAHHDNYVSLALDETLELSRAVARAAELLSEEDSLLVVTADHAHVMGYSGYTHRGSDILGLSDDRGDDGLPYTTLSYINGPGYRPPVDGHRDDVSQYDYKDPELRFPSGVPLESETHGGDDVGVFARGPHHDLFTGVYEQSQLPFLMAYAGCFGPGAHACDETD